MGKTAVGAGCHGSQVGMKDVRLDSPWLTMLPARNVYRLAVVKAMPLNKATPITEAERG